MCDETSSPYAVGDTVELVALTTVDGLSGDRNNIYDVELSEATSGATFLMSAGVAAIACAAVI